MRSGRRRSVRPTAECLLESSWDVRTALVYGVRTEAADLPSGAATYIGGAHSRTQLTDNPNQNGRLDIDGRVRLSADFDGSTLDGRIHNLWSGRLEMEEGRRLRFRFAAADGGDRPWHEAGARLRCNYVRPGFRTGAATLPHRCAKSDSDLETGFPGGRPVAAAPHRKRTESGSSRQGGGKPPSRIVACAPSCLPERIDDLKALHLSAVLEIFGEQDIRPGIECGLHDQGVPVRES